MGDIIGLDGEAVTHVKKLIDVNPCGNQVLLELLTKKEALGTKLAIDDSVSINGAPQGYVLKIGQMVSKEWGFTVGNRVTLHGNYTPLPENIQGRKNAHRPLILVDPHQIKAVLVEED